MYYNKYINNILAFFLYTVMSSYIFWGNACAMSCKHIDMVIICNNNASLMLYFYAYNTDGV